MTSEIDHLDDLFAAAAAQREVPSAPLVTRILKDADHEQPQPRPLVTARLASPKGRLAALADWFGGGFSLAGMSMAALTGLYLGVAQPTPVLALTDLVTGQTVMESLEVLPSTGALWTQE
jgi:hypothetical protein